ncbi:MAG: bifunctional oligoribonuclease/PAP phosphatase NrnA [Desulfobacteraceae bacterium]|nr:MAG: bifunctional oligoribonuclease/PAP phosphatase NrnA [Desulfobacteraceae bacterium]
MNTQQIINQLKKSERILIASHANPDGDAIGSLISLGIALEDSKKKVWLYNESPIPAVYQFLPSLHLVHQTVRNIAEFDTAIILDCSDLHRIGEAAEAVSKIPILINIDHHDTNTRFGRFQYIDPTASSTAEIVYRIITALNVPINTGIAYSIYTGIMADTGSFRFANTTAEAFEISHKMVRYGADPHKVAHHVYETFSLNRIKLLNMLYDSIELSPNGKMSIMTLTQNMLKTTGTKLEDVNGLINYAKQIENVKLAVLLFESNRGNGKKFGSDFHVSLRSEGAVNVAAIASSFGGGGHQNAAGFDIHATLPDLKKTIFYFSETL